MKPTTCVLVVASFLLTACDGWKKVDQHAGLILVPNVKVVNENGRDLIQLRGKFASAFVDPVGGKVAIFRLQRRSTFTYEEPKDRWQNGPTAVEHKYPVGDNVFGPTGEWATSSGNSQRDESLMWQVDAGGVFITLLSDTVEGLRWRKTFEMHENGVLDVTVRLENTTGSDIEARAESLVTPAAPTAGNQQHTWANGQWFSRAIIAPPDATGFVFGPSTIPARGHVQWTERWWITPAKDDKNPPKKIPAVPTSAIDPFLKRDFDSMYYR